MKKLSLIAILSAFLSLPLWADVIINPKAGTTSATFLKIGIGSRANAMGDSFAGLADDLTAIYWNPAGLVQLQRDELNLTHNEMFENIRHDFAGFAFRKWGGVAGVAIYGLYTPQDIERRSGIDESDPYEPISPVEGYFMAYDMALQFSYARQIRKDTSVGASFKVIRQDIDSIDGYGAAFDFGILHHFESRPLSLGFVIQHAGTPIKLISQQYDLPLNLKFGAAYKWNDKLTTVFDLNQPNDDYLFISGGFEYSLLKFMFLRAGYKYRWYGLELDDVSGLSGGMGFVLPVSGSNVKFDYAFLPFGVLGNSQRVSIGIEFGSFWHERAKFSRSETAAVKPAGAAQPPAQAALSAAPAMPGPLDGYTVFRTAAEAKLKMISGRSLSYAIVAVSTGSDLQAIAGDARSQGGVANFNLDIGEKEGAQGSRAYKTFAFAHTLGAPIWRVRINLRLPKALINPSAKTKLGKKLQIDKLSEDENYAYYLVNMTDLEEFTISHE